MDLVNFNVFRYEKLLINGKFCRCINLVILRKNNISIYFLENIKILI